MNHWHGTGNVDPLPTRQTEIWSIETSLVQLTPSHPDLCRYEPFTRHYYSGSPLIQTHIVMTIDMPLLQSTPSHHHLYRHELLTRLYYSGPPTTQIYVDMNHWHVTITVDPLQQKFKEAWTIKTSLVQSTPSHPDICRHKPLTRNYYSRPFPT